MRSNNSYNAPTGSDNYGAAVLPSGLPGHLPERLAGAGSGGGAVQWHHHQPKPTTTQYYIPQNYRNGYIEIWNLAIQRQLPFHFSLDVAYVGSHGVDTPANVNLNAGQVIGAGSTGQPFFVKYGTTAAVSSFSRDFRRRLTRFR